MGRIHTYYDNLKVSRDAPDAVIRAAYRALAQQYHPDKNSNSTEATRVMKVINGAYAVLSNPAKRIEHDTWIKLQEGLEKRTAPRFTSEPQSAPAPQQPIRRWPEQDLKGLKWVGAVVFVGVVLNYLYEPGQQSLRDVTTTPTTQPKSAPAVTTAFDPDSAREVEPKLLSDDEVFGRSRSASTRKQPAPANRSTSKSAEQWGTGDQEVINASRSANAEGQSGPRREGIEKPFKFVPLGEPKDELEPLTRSGYLPTSRRSANSGLSTFAVDNSNGERGALVRLYLGGRKPEVRAFYVRQGDKFAARSLSPGTYVMRYRFIGSDDTFEADSAFVLT